MIEVRVDDTCNKCGKKSLGCVNWTTSGSVIIMLVECFTPHCGVSKTITRKVKENEYGKAKGVDTIPSISKCSS